MMQSVDCKHHPKRQKKKKRERRGRAGRYFPTRMQYQVCLEYDQVSYIAITLTSRDHGSNSDAHQKH